MNYVCEIIMPCTDNIEEAVSTILDPFCQRKQYPSEYSFWNDYEIGCKLPDYKDVCRLDQVYRRLESTRVIIAGPSQDDSSLVIKFIMQPSVWNGVNKIYTPWDGTIESTLRMYKSEIQSYDPDYRAKLVPQPDWLAVAVSYDKL